MTVEFTEYEYEVLNILVEKKIEHLRHDLQRAAGLGLIESNHGINIQFNLSVYKRLLFTIKNHTKKVVREHDSNDEYLDWLEKMQAEATVEHLKLLKMRDTMSIFKWPQRDSDKLNGLILALDGAIANYKKLSNSKG